MGKETFYFSHDYGSRNDPKLIKVLMKLGQAGKGVYWDLVEMLYEQDGQLTLVEIESYAFALRVDCDIIRSLVNDFNLFETDGEFFWSASVNRRLDQRKEKSDKAAKSANERWSKPKNSNAMRTQSDSNAIKESKVNNNKEKDNKENNTSEKLVVVDFEVANNFFIESRNCRVLQEINKIPQDDISIYFKRFFDEKIDIGELNNKSPGDIVKHFTMWLPKILLSEKNNSNPFKKNNDRATAVTESFSQVQRRSTT
ncbi:MAG TPA: Lin1244/Lin1753 domain-containing protein [Mucilaginibacter sp.]|jgi:hypothetical protein